MAIVTRLTKLLKCDIPIISAPMGGIAMEDLACAVSSSGGFGFIGTVNAPSKDTKLEITKARQRLGIKPGDPIPIGVGFIGWVLDKTEITEDPRIPAVLEEKPTAVWFSFGVDLGKYVNTVRAYDAKRDHKTIIFVIVSSVEEALRAANEWDVDVLVVQGIEAGGHGGSEAPPLLTLLQAVLNALPNGPPIVAAGGISSGEQIAALLTMGADGVVLGTRFLFTPESKYSDIKKQVLLSAGINDTTRSMAFDEVGRTMGWPPKCDGRAVANDIITDERAGLSLETRLMKFDESTRNGETSRLVVWAGTGVGLTNSMTPAADVVEELREGIIRSLRRASSLM